MTVSIASNALADRLRRLEEAGLVSRRDDSSHKRKVIYSLNCAATLAIPLLAEHHQEMLQAPAHSSRPEIGGCIET